tara:strand:+ start:340 stop:540 length:201 start_codon:yes stop_codon:yes gene_type:complete
MWFIHGAIVGGWLDIGRVPLMLYEIIMPVKHTKTDYLKFAILFALLCLIQSCISDQPIWEWLLESN